MKAIVALFLTPLVGLSGVAVYLCLLNSEQITQASYDQIRLGMPLSEIQSKFANVGEELKDGCTFPFLLREAVDMQAEVGVDDETHRGWTWSGQDIWIFVRIDENGCVAARGFCRYKPLKPLERIRRWLFEN